jgi:hypothetical protein
VSAIATEIVETVKLKGEATEMMGYPNCSIVQGDGKERMFGATWGSVKVQARFKLKLLAQFG